MYLTGFADEAAPDIDGQIRATKELGWRYIEARNIGGVNIHDLPDEEFALVQGKLEEAAVSVNCFGSAIGNWAADIRAPFDICLARARRAIPRMRRLDTQLIRLMSYPPLADRAPDDQMEEERFRRLHELYRMFTEAGLTPVHENCLNYGGMSWRHTLKLVEHVPGLKLVFDTGNPVFTDDHAKPKPYPKQSAWEFYSQVKEHVVYVHIKDGRWDRETQKVTYTYPGEGSGDVVRIVRDLIRNGYDGGFSIEPHIAVVAHDSSEAFMRDLMCQTYLEYGRRMEGILAAAGPVPKPIV